jgi:hypothetical protein
MKALFRIVLEHLAHGGAENGHLPVTYRDFEACGVASSNVRRTLAELEVLGFIERMKRGGQVYGSDKGTPALYRLTWIGDRDGARPTNEWRLWEDLNEAKALARGLKTTLQDVKKRKPQKRLKAKPAVPQSLRTAASE